MLFTESNFCIKMLFTESKNRQFSDTTYKKSKFFHKKASSKYCDEAFCFLLDNQSRWINGAIHGGYPQRINTFGQTAYIDFVSVAEGSNRLTVKVVDSYFSGKFVAAKSQTFSHSSSVIM